MVRAGSPPEFAAMQEPYRFDADFPAHLGQASGQVRLGRTGSKINWASVKPAARACSLSSRARVILPSSAGRRERPGIKEQEHQVGLMVRGQGQNLPEFFLLQGAGVEDGAASGPPPGPGPGPGRWGCPG